MLLATFLMYFTLKEKPKEIQPIPEVKLDEDANLSENEEADEVKPTCGELFRGSWSDIKKEKRIPIAMLGTFCFIGLWVNVPLYGSVLYYEMGRQKEYATINLIS